MVALQARTNECNQLRPKCLAENSEEASEAVVAVAVAVEAAIEVEIKVADETGERLDWDTTRSTRPTRNSSATTMD